MSLSLTKTFRDALQEGFKAAKNLESKDKALAYAELAKAIAMTGLVEDLAEGPSDVTDSAPKEDTKTVAKTETKKPAATNTKKDSLKTDAGKGTAPVKEAVEEKVPEEEEVVPTEETTAVADEVAIDEEWTDAMTSAKAEALETLKAYTDAWGEDYVYNDCVNAWSEGAFSGADNIRPTNIDGFITYLEQISTQE